MVHCKFIRDVRKNGNIFVLWLSYDQGTRFAVIYDYGSIEETVTTEPMAAGWPEVQKDNKKLSGEKSENSFLIGDGKKYLMLL
ncbi:MAG: hypothetical protein JXB18_09110 [Sedimentisphaerales bacterium]|nr:hypothetical protein [Sedimentisphaerales bacterium]